VQSSTITKLSEENIKLKKEREELLAELRFLRAGKKKRELFNNSNQGLLEFPANGRTNRRRSEVGSIDREDARGQEGQKG
jgi:hypothetical protein